MPGSRPAAGWPAMVWLEAQLRTALVDLLQIHAALLGEAQGGLGRVTAGVEGGLQRRTV